MVLAVIGIKVITQGSNSRGDTEMNTGSDKSHAQEVLDGIKVVRTQTIVL